jgi:RNA recognition motif-containing protein
MNSKESEIPDLFISTIRSINNQTPKEWNIEERTWHPKTVQEELKNFITELMVEWGCEEKWGGIEKVNIPKNMSRYASTYFGFLRFKNRSAHSVIANQLNGVFFNDGRLTVELNKYPPRDIHLQIHSETTFKYNPQLKQRYSKGQQENNVLNHGPKKQAQTSDQIDSEDEFDIISVHDSTEQQIHTKKETETQVDTVTVEIERLEDTVKNLKEKLIQTEEQLQEATKSKLQLNSTIKTQAKRLAELSEENQNYCELINKLKVAIISTK